MKTIEEIYKSSAVFISKGKKKGTYSLLDVVTHAMQEYANQQIELAVDKTLEIVSGDVDGSFCYDGGSMCCLDAMIESILSLRTQILNEIKDR